MLMSHVWDILTWLDAEEADLRLYQEPGLMLKRLIWGCIRNLAWWRRGWFEVVSGTGLGDDEADLRLYQEPGLMLKRLIWCWWGWFEVVSGTWLDADESCLRHTYLAWWWWGWIAEKVVVTVVGGWFEDDQKPGLLRKLGLQLMSLALKLNLVLNYYLWSFWRLGDGGDEKFWRDSEGR